MPRGRRFHDIKLLIEQGSQPEFVCVKGLTSRLFKDTISSDDPSSKVQQVALITPATIEKICKRNGLFHVPDRVRTSIEGCLINDDENAVTTEYLRLMGDFQQYQNLMIPAHIDYYANGELTLDAYITYYLSRYMFIPSVALRDLTLHPFFQNVPDSFNVLDLGSGTGAVVLGLLSLFSNNPLSQVAINITTLDCCAEALGRQKDLIKKAGFNSKQVHHYEQDLCDMDSCIKLAKKDGPYYLIFIANCLTELEHDVAKNLVGRMPEILVANGAIIIAEAQRDYIKKLINDLAANAEEHGLHVYYPCPATGCPYPWCWVWRYHKYRLPSIKVGGQSLQEEPRDELISSWLILTRQNISVYDTFKEKNKDLLWGPISKETGTERAACFGDKRLPFKMNDDVSPSYRRGSIVGLSSELKVKKYHEM